MATVVHEDSIFHRHAVWGRLIGETLTRKLQVDHG